MLWFGLLLIISNVLHQVDADVIGAPVPSGTTVLLRNPSLSSIVNAADLAIDGDMNPDSAWTKKEVNAWFKAEFTTTPVKAIWIKMGAFYSSADRAVISVSLYKNNVLVADCGNITDAQTGLYTMKVYPCANTVADSLKIEVTSGTADLYVTEVVLFKDSPCNKPTIGNGGVSPNTATINSGLRYTVSCSGGYVLNGQAAMTCTRGTLSSAPTCLGGYVNQCTEGEQLLQDGTCVDCERGDFGWRDQCHVCPPGKSTVSGGAAYDDCIYDRYIACKPDGKEYTCKKVNCPCNYNQEECDSGYFCRRSSYKSKGVFLAPNLMVLVLLLVSALVKF